MNIDNKSEILTLLSLKNIQLELSVFDTNDEKPSLIFIHGNSSSKKAFTAQIQHFSKKYRVIAIDLLGHGESTKISNIENLSLHEKNLLCETFYNPITMIASVKQLLESKDIDKAHIIGWSLGGHIAYGIANETQSFIASIITIGSPPVMFSTEGFKHGFSEWFVNTLVSDWVQNPRHYQRSEAIEIQSHVGFKNDDKYFTNDLIHSDPQMRRHLFLKLCNYDTASYIGSVLDGERFVKETNIPICLIVGENDSGIKSRYISSFDTHLKNTLSEVRIVKLAPHAVFNSNPDEFYKIVDTFLEKVATKQTA